MKEAPQTFTFYSFKGGVGRSMAVLNLAYALVARGRHVLVLDMDLEAPGLSGFLYRNDEIAGCARFDIVDLVGWASSAALPLDPLSFPPLTDYVVPVVREKLEKIPRVLSELGRLDILPVDEERDYYGRLSSLEMGGYDQDALVRTGSVLRAWLRSLRFPIEAPDYYGPNFDRTAGYDYVLVDSRTGITEIGGLCIGPLSDSLVVITAMNDQNVVGTRSFLREIGLLEVPGSSQMRGIQVAADALRGQSRKPYLVVASLVPAGEIETKKVRMAELENSLGTVAARLSYHPQLALKETIFTRDHPDEYLARDYERLLESLLRMANDGVDENMLKAAFSKARTSAELLETLTNLRRCAWQPGIEHALHAVLTRETPAGILDERVFLVCDQIYRTLSIGRSLHSPAIATNWANLLAYWSLRSADPLLGHLRLAEAMTRYATILESEDSTPREKALALFNRGVLRSQRGELQSAVLDYTSVLSLEGVGVELRALTFVNRAVTHRMADDLQNAIADCATVIRMDDAPVEQKTRARLLRAESFEKLAEPENAIADFSSIIRMPDAAPAFKSVALSGRALAYSRLGKREQAVADCTAVIQMTEAPIEPKIQALMLRANTYHERNESLAAIDDYTALLQMNDVPAEIKTFALFCRGILYGIREENDKAITDFTTMIERRDIPVAKKTEALLLRGFSRQIDAEDEAVSDFTSVIDAPAVSADRRSEALFQRGLIWIRRREYDFAIADFTVLIDMADAPSRRKASALLFRGFTHRTKNQRKEAIADFTEVIELPYSPPEERARALLSRVSMYDQELSFDDAVRDLSAVIALEGAPPELRAESLIWRGSKFRDRGEPEKAGCDFSSAIELPGASIAQQAKALGARGWVHFLAARYDEAIKDDVHALALSPGECLILGNLALALLVVGKSDEALEKYNDALVLADVKQLEALAVDLRKVIDEHGQIPGAELAQTRVNAQSIKLQEKARTIAGQPATQAAGNIDQEVGVEGIY
jgi:tetratricopeptide (TPR) repeat protein